MLAIMENGARNFRFLTSEKAINKGNSAAM